MPHVTPEPRAETARKARLHGGWIGETILRLSGGDMTQSDVLKRAVWAKKDKNAWTLRCLVRDGAAILATVRLGIWSGCVWEAGKQQGWADTHRGAMRAARKALREAGKP